MQLEQNFGPNMELLARPRGGGMREVICGLLSWRLLLGFALGGCVAARRGRARGCWRSHGSGRLRNDRILLGTGGIRGFGGRLRIVYGRSGRSGRRGLLAQDRAEDSEWHLREERAIACWRVRGVRWRVFMAVFCCGVCCQHIQQHGSIYRP